MAVLHENRLIEAEGVTQLRDLAGRCAFAKHLFHRVAGNDVNQKKNKGEHQPECGQREKKAMQEVANHLLRSQGALSRKGVKLAKGEGFSAPLHRSWISQGKAAERQLAIRLKGPRLQEEAGAES